MKRIIFLLISLAVVITSCKKKDDQPATTNGSYSFTMNGQHYTGFAGGAYTETSDMTEFTIAGGKEDLSQSFGITIDLHDKKKVPGTYEDCLFLFNPEATNSNTGFFGSATVVISSINDSYAEGTFTGEAGNNGNEYMITQGSFKISVR